ncbi:structural protein [Cellulophaga phage phi39:1]|uniref:structural protein n=1 Tax=Cellulophaga phage phi39:1 TaxID=1327993 RepID=UPI0003517462|nr:structural protein [Cellulophaga phage phi39:1]AGO49138.1 structural protein [Cellulophaga phage phi39:1]
MRNLLHSLGPITLDYVQNMKLIMFLFLILPLVLQVTLQVNLLSIKGLIKFIMGSVRHRIGVGVNKSGGTGKGGDVTAPSPVDVRDILTADTTKITADSTNNTADGGFIFSADSTRFNADSNGIF